MRLHPPGPRRGWYIGRSTRLESGSPANRRRSGSTPLPSSETKTESVSPRLESGGPGNGARVQVSPSPPILICGGRSLIPTTMPMPTKELQREYQREWRKRRRNQWIRENGPCRMCGSRKNLEVDHVDPASKLDHNVWSWRKERRDRELRKCQVLCSSCHKKKTNAQRHHPPHGTHNRYVAGCRCAACRMAHNTSTREWRYKAGLRIPHGKPWRRRG